MKLLTLVRKLSFELAINHDLVGSSDLDGRAVRAPHRDRTLVVDQVPLWESVHQGVDCISENVKAVPAFHSCIGAALALVNEVTKIHMEAITHDKPLGTWEGYAMLALILASSVCIRNIADVVALEEQHLRYSLIGIDLCRERRSVREL